MNRKYRPTKDRNMVLVLNLRDKWDNIFLLPGDIILFRLLTSDYVNCVRPLLFVLR